VGIVTRTLLEQWVTRATRNAFSTGLGLREDDAVAWVSAIAALHDLGKATPVFQSLSNLDAERLETVGLKPHRVTQRIRHDRLTAVLLPDVFVARLVGPQVLDRLARLLGGHHGRLGQRPALHAAQLLGGPDWAQARRFLAGEILDVFGIEHRDSPVSIDDGVAVRLLGITVMADWLASAPEICPYVARSDRPVPPLDIAGRSRSLAESVPARLRRLGLSRPPRTTAARPFERLFPGLDGPRPGQRVVERCLKGLSEPGLLLIEDATGAGKTESAFMAVHHALSELDARGAFIALPTKATSDQAFRRLREFLAASFDDRTELHLLHSSAAMSADYEALRSLSNWTHPQMREIRDGAPGSDDEGERTGTVGASAWFAQRRRGLLAAFAVGTVDQGLLAALPVKHHALRLAALADRVVVVDEVHAYDAYMGTILERLLEWLGALKTTVVLLSATLPSRKREALLCAYARGAGYPDALAPPVDYPRVLTVTPQGVTGLSVPRTDATTCCVVRVDGGADPQSPLGGDVCETIHTAVSKGACVAVIMNTVGRAQAAYTQLSALIPLRQRRLLHARFRFIERDEIERVIVAELGPPGTSNRPNGMVVVATQVIEQSLDIDFDLLVTDLAPIDLLLQRKGRLHRHDRARPPGMEQARMLVIVHESGDGIQLDIASSRVYAPHILLRTWLALRDHREILVPDDVDALIGAVYDECDAPTELALRAQWEETRAELERARRDELMARNIRVSAPGADEPFDAAPFADGDEERDLRARTRLGVSCSAVVLRVDEAHYADHALDGSVVRALLERSVTFSQPAATHALFAHAAPVAWQENPFLHDHRLLQLDETGSWRATEGSRPLSVRLDSELGVVNMA
jgi:CRISPR-associated endonuclease/helicase Cas3